MRPKKNDNLPEPDKPEKAKDFPEKSPKIDDRGIYEQFLLEYKRQFVSLHSQIPP